MEMDWGLETRTDLVMATVMATELVKVMKLVREMERAKLSVWDSQSDLVKVSDSVMVQVWVRSPGFADPLVLVTENR